MDSPFKQEANGGHVSWRWMDGWMMGMLDFYLQHRPPERARPVFKSIAIGDRRSVGQTFGKGDWLLVQMYMSPSEAMKSVLLTMFHHASKGANKERLSITQKQLLERQVHILREMR